MGQGRVWALCSGHQALTGHGVCLFTHNLEMLLPPLKVAFGNSDKNAIISQVSSQPTFSMQGQKAKGLGFAGNTITIATQLHSRGLEAVVDGAQLDVSQSKPASSWI